MILKIPKLKNKTLVTDDTKEYNKDTLFLKTNLNKKYINSKIDENNIITADELINHLKIKTKIIGITGTNGKTTTAFLIGYILKNLGYKVGIQGTEGFFVDLKQKEPKTLTTPLILTTIKRLYENDLDFFIMEVSSHAIAQNRIDSLKFDAKVFTNISQDHLDYHKTFEEYKKVKESFFKDDSLKIINKDEEINVNNKNTFFYSKNDFELLKKPFLKGEFNKYNLLAAIYTVYYLTHIDLNKIISIAESFSGVAGRMEIVSFEPQIIIDFAHTPDGMEKVLSSLNHKNIICVFGAGGDRDKSKRFFMGEVADKFCKRIYLTNDNPRSENEKKIVQDILNGIKNKDKVDITLNRFEAIKKAINSLQKNEILVILGKGNEKYIYIKDKKIPFSDKIAVKKILKGESYDVS